MYKGTRLEEEYPEMLVYLKLWSSNATILWGIHIFLGVLATFFSLLAAAGIGALLEEHTKVFAFIAAVSISLLTAFNLGAKSNNTRDAWREFNIAAIKFNRGQIGKDKLIKAYENGESRIGHLLKVVLMQRILKIQAIQTWLKLKKARMVLNYP